MSSTTEIGSPFTLASLPRPINAHGRTYAAGVHSINGSKKRKRTEMAVAVDGEGILIYSLQNPQLVTSYALPPQTSFAAAPHSLYRKRNSKAPARRHTYAAVSQPSSPGFQLLCFTETIEKDGTTDTVKTNYASSHKIISIDACLVLDGTHDVLVVLEDGSIVCLSSDLQQKRWESNLRALLPKSYGTPEIEHIVTTTGKATIDGLLRNRQDIAAILDPSLSGNAEVLDLIPVVCVIFRRTNHQRILGLFQLQPRSPDIITHQLTSVKHLVTLELASDFSPPANQESHHFALHSSTGHLHELAGSRLVSYDLSGTIPRVYSDFQIPDPSIGTFLRISSDLIFTSSQKAYGIFDVKYSSLQALLPFGQKSGESGEGKKRKHVEPKSAEEPEEAPTLITYFNDLRLAVGISNHEMFGIQLGETFARKRTKTGGSLLIDSIGKGIGAAHFEKDLTEWKKRAQKLNKHASKGKVADFEEAFAADLEIELLSDSMIEESGDISMNGFDENTERQLRRWQLPAVITEAERYRHRHKALFALSKIFQFAASADERARQGSLKITFFPPNVFQWLLLSGFVTKESIRRAIVDDSPEQQDLANIISDGDVVKALVEYDPELHILSAVLNHSHSLPVGEVVQAIRVLVQSLDERPKADSMPKLLTNGTGATDDSMDVDLDSELDAATHDLDHALSILDNGLLIRSHTLRPALIRLHTFPAPVISSTLRSIMPRTALKSLIILLHSELKNGGWTSSYDFVEPGTASAEDPENQAVAIIASLLSCALDAIGTSAWLTMGGSGQEDSQDKMIEELLFDTSATLNGFWEARFMRGLLSEFLRYASSSAKTARPSSQKLQKQGKPFSADIAKDGELPMLPLGGKADVGIEKKKPGKGGKSEERSAREMGMLISKRVPKYSFERIVL